VKPFGSKRTTQPTTVSVASNCIDSPSPRSAPTFGAK